MRVERVEDAVLQTLGGKVLRPEVVMAVVDGVLKELLEPTRRDDLDQLGGEQKALTKEIERLTTAIAAGRDIPSLLEALRVRQARLESITTTLSSRSAPMEKFDRKAIEKAVRQRLAEWRQLLTTRVEDGRQLLREVLTEPLRFIPERKIYRFEGKVGLKGLLTGAVPLHLLVRPQADVREWARRKHSSQLVSLRNSPSYFSARTVLA